MIGVGIVLLVAGCGGPAASATRATHDIQGTFDLMLDRGLVGGERTGDSCAGEGGYGDIGPGVQVVVRDQSGETIGAGDLSAGTLGRDPTVWTCQFTFTIPDVPAATFYEVEVGDRGALTYSAAEMEEQDWQVGFTLGP